MDCIVQSMVDYGHQIKIVLNIKITKILKLGYQKIYLDQNMKITKLNDHVSDIDTLTMGLRLSDGVEITKLRNKSIIDNNSLEKLKRKNLITLVNDRLKVNKRHMIKLNSIINFLISP